MEYIPLDIKADNFIDSYRSIGYSIETAIADIIDNSIAAKATEIRVNMIWDDLVKGEPIIQILDNGYGMSNEELIESMRLACRSPLEVRDITDLGRFGLGLKSASFSQCRLLTVVSRKEGFELTCKQWDINHIKSVHKFELTDCTVKEAGVEDMVPSGQGTSVIWRTMDQLNIPSESTEKKKEHFWRQIKLKVREHIAITYGSFSGTIKFFFNDNPIELWDPFLTNHEGTKRTIEETILFNNHSVGVTSYILPKKLDGDELEKATLGRSMNELQGFYLYRNNRLIRYGGWFGLPKLTNKEAYRLARIRIDIDNTMDPDWNIDIKKECATCPPAIVEKLVSYAKTARRDSSRIFRSKGKILRKTLNSKESVFLWTYGSKDNKAFYSINRNNPLVSVFTKNLDDDQMEMFDMVLKALENFIPVQSILESESNGNYVENIASEISDDEIKKTFLELIDNMIENDNCDFLTAAKFLRGNEPFINHLEVVDKIIEQEGYRIDG